MIVVIVDSVFNTRRNCYESIVSHGIDYDTGRSIVLPQVRPEEMSAEWDSNLQEYVLDRD